MTGRTMTTITPYYIRTERVRAKQRKCFGILGDRSSTAIVGLGRWVGLLNGSDGRVQTVENIIGDARMGESLKAPGDYVLI